MEQTIINKKIIQHIRNETKTPDLVTHSYNVDVFLCKKNPGFAYEDSARPFFYDAHYAKENPSMSTEDVVKTFKGFWESDIFETEKTSRATFSEVSVLEGFVFVKKSDNTHDEDYRTKSYIKVVIDGVVKYYFITSTKFIDRHTVSYRVVLDTITTYLDKLSFQGETRVKRQHVDRWVKDGNVFKPNWGINSPMWREESDINLRNFVPLSTLGVNVDESGISDETKTLAFNSKNPNAKPYYVIGTIKQNNTGSTFSNTKLSDGIWTNGAPFITTPVWPNEGAIREYDSKNVFMTEGGKKRVNTRGLGTGPDTHPINLPNVFNQYASSVLYNFMAIPLPFRKTHIYSTTIDISWGIIEPRTDTDLKIISNLYAKTAPYDPDHSDSYKDKEIPSLVGYVSKSPIVWKEEWKGNIAVKHDITLDPSDQFELDGQSKVRFTWADGTQVIVRTKITDTGFWYAETNDNRWIASTNGSNIENKSNDTGTNLVSIETLERNTGDMVDYVTGDLWDGNIDLTKLGFKVELDATKQSLEQDVNLDMETKLKTPQFNPLEIRSTTGQTFKVNQMNNTDGKMNYNFTQYITPENYRKKLVFKDGLYAIKRQDNSASFIVDETLIIPSLSSSYNDFFQNHLSRYETSKAGIDLQQRQQTVNNIMGIVGSTATGASSIPKMNPLGIGASALGLAGSITRLAFNRQNANFKRRQIKSMTEDLARTPSTINNNNVDTFLNIDSRRDMNIGNTGMVAVVRELPPVEKQQVHNLFNRFGYEVDKLKSFNDYSELQTRHLFSHWDIEDFSTCVNKSSIPPEALKEIDELFETGVTLWVSNGTKDNINDYTKENWELPIVEEIIK